MLGRTNQLVPRSGKYETQHDGRARPLQDDVKSSSGHAFKSCDSGLCEESAILLSIPGTALSSAKFLVSLVPLTMFLLIAPPVRKPGITP